MKRGDWVVVTEGAPLSFGFYQAGAVGICVAEPSHVKFFSMAKRIKANIRWGIRQDCWSVITDKVKVIPKDVARSLITLQKGTMYE